MQIVRYGVVGIAHNSVGYLIYLFVTWLGADPKLVVSIFYPIGASISFYANRQWTFSHDGHITRSFSRFIIAHIGGYLLNIVLLYGFVDILEYPHQLIQAIAIFVVAGYLFLMLRFFVFPERYEKHIESA